MFFTGKSKFQTVSLPGKVPQLFTPWCLSLNIGNIGKCRVFWKKLLKKIIAILFKPFSGSFPLQSHFKVKKHENTQHCNNISMIGPWYNYIYVIWTQGLGPTGLPGLPGYSGWNPLAHEKKTVGEKMWAINCSKFPAWTFKSTKKNCPVGTLNANLRKQCANLVNMPDWHIGIKRSEIKWRKNFWLSVRHE